ncbi:TPA: hypothetical protein I7203_21585 [Vibrio vulnificus]|uniref:hypothetical protein n=1 Tax=Vibrio TaxID=662 RepID=UPI00076B604C|nr:MULTISPECIES: hypothetical protein [Vibrio]ATI48417.1 hypothetical protein CO725_23590 [Vibrio parahaemolyticus]EKD9327720.1 hypothetical protein [Vibrio vulnificus]ELQ2342303.1 hypothetical protein [Vibrio vulnificus]ELV8679723.1 hypothetical protein [Vibrio vulnificus]MBN8143017.1 hypothetical protein [Vibrio vulnificus]
MAITYMEILDTAVKIGLGALISGATTWKITQLQHKNDDEKQRRARKLESLESVAEQVEVFSHHSMVYWARIVDFTRRKSSGSKLSEDFLKELNEARTNLYRSYKNLNSAESKLLLLGLSDSQQSLRAFGEAVSSFYAEVYVGEHGKPLEEVKLWREDILDNRRIFFEDLSSAYEKS